jgi:hypothetical protein
MYTSLLNIVYFKYILLHNFHLIFLLLKVKKSLISYMELKYNKRLNVFCVDTNKFKIY